MIAQMMLQLLCLMPAFYLMPAFSTIHWIYNVIATTVNMQRFIPCVTARETRGRSALNIACLEAIISFIV